MAPPAHTSACSALTDGDLAFRTHPAPLLCVEEPPWRILRPACSEVMHLQCKLLPHGEKATKAFKSKVLFRERTRSHPSRRQLFFFSGKQTRSHSLPFCILHLPLPVGIQDALYSPSSASLLLRGQSSGVSTHCLSISDSPGPQGAEESDT